MTPQEKQDAVRISRVMRAGRKISGKNQTEVSKLIGVSQSALSKFESAILIPSASQWFRISQMLELDMIETFTFGTIDNGLSATLGNAYPKTTFKIPKKYAHSAGSKVRTIRPFLQYFETQIGEEKLERYLKENKVDPDFFVVQDNQLNIGFTLDLATHLIKAGKLGKKDIPVLTKPLSDSAMHGVMSKSYNMQKNEVQLLQTLVDNAKKYEINCDYKVEAAGRNSLDISVTPSEHLAQFDYKSALLGDFLCRYKKSYIQQFSTYKGAKRVEMEESECHFKGADRCVYHIKAAS